MAEARAAGKLAKGTRGTLSGGVLNTPPDNEITLDDQGIDKHLAKRIKELQPEASNKAVAKMLGAGHSTVDRDVAPNGAGDEQKAQGKQSATAPNGAPARALGTALARRR
jgi:hypothetical protein